MCAVAVAGQERGSCRGGGAGGGNGAEMRGQVQGGLHTVPVEEGDRYCCWPLPLRLHLASGPQPHAHAVVAAVQCHSGKQNRAL
jgi:hypothetical protein